MVVSKAGGHLRTFTTLEFEHEDYQGRYTARCFAFDKVHGKHVQVFSTYSYNDYMMLPKLEFYIATKNSVIILCQYCVNIVSIILIL